MIKSRKYDYSGNEKEGFFEIVCDDCGAHLKAFRLGLEVCSDCQIDRLSGREVKK